MKRIIGIVSGIIGIALLLLGAFLIGKIIFNRSNTAIIGGADTPTFIFLIRNSNIALPAIGIITGFLFIIASCILLFKKKR